MSDSNKLIIKISNISAESLENNPDGLLQHISPEDQKRLQEYILDRLSSLDGGPSVSTYRIANFSWDSHLKKGRFRLNFTIDRRFCCSDTESCATDYLDFDFTVQETVLTATTEYFEWALNN